MTNRIIQPKASDLLNPRVIEITRNLFLRKQNLDYWYEILGIEKDNTYKLCDICGGIGKIAQWLLNNNQHLSAVVVDNDSNYLNYGLKHIVSNATRNRISFVLSDAISIKLNDNACDVSFIHGAFHQISNYKKLIKEMIRISKKRIVIFLADLDYSTPYNMRTKSEIELQIESLEKQIFNRFTNNFKFVRKATYKDIINELQKNKIREIELNGIFTIINFSELSETVYENYLDIELKANIERLNKFAATFNVSIKNELSNLYIKLKTFKLSEKYDRTNWLGGPQLIIIGKKNDC